MATTFKIGQQVRCIKREYNELKGNIKEFPKYGEKYTISRIEYFNGYGWVFEFEEFDKGQFYTIEGFEHALDYTFVDNLIKSL